MTIPEIQEKILAETGLKTSVSTIKKGSMRGYTKIMVMFQGGKYPDMPFDFRRELKRQLDAIHFEPYPAFCSASEVCIFQAEGDGIKMKRESKPKIDDSIPKGWGSKNSQMRLSKICARNAKRIQKGNTARYW